MALYLHYLDRELRRSVDQNFSTHDYLGATAAVLLCTAETLYAGLSLIFETGAQDPLLHSALLALIQTRHFQPVSHHPTIEEFLDTRRTLYEHDAARYPAYFHPSLESLQEAGISIVYKEQSSTTSLVQDLDQCVRDFAVVEAGRSLGPEINKQAITNALARGLEARGHKAVTYAAFAPALGNSANVNEHYLIRRLISEYYTLHYMHYLAADIMTGLPGIGYYDYLCHRFPLLDFQLWAAVIAALSGRNPSDPEFYTPVRHVQGGRGSPEHQAFVTHLHRLLAASAIVVAPHGVGRFSRVRNTILSFLQHILADVPGLRSASLTRFQWPHFCTAGALILEQAIEKRSKTDPEFQSAVRNTKAIESGMKTRILICTAADIEPEMLQNRLQVLGLAAVPKYEGSFAYWDYGEYKNSRIYATQSQAGGGGGGGALLTVDDGIRSLKPHFIISLGIAFGASEEDQSIGDILISRQVQDYERVRAGERAVIPRGDKMPAHPVLYARCDVAKASWTRCRVHPGLLLSGEKLVDDPKLKKFLWKLFPEAIGGEMEGAGIAAACYRRQVPWIIVKSICDWGENKGDEGHALAARRSIDFFIHALQEGAWSDFGLQAGPTS
jgi:nucleoside phosphorylase